MCTRKEYDGVGGGVVAAVVLAAFMLEYHGLKDARSFWLEFVDVIFGCTLTGETFACFSPRRAAPHMVTGAGSTC